MSSRDELIRYILRYCSIYLDDPKVFWPEKAYKERIYMRTACFQLIESLMDNPNMDPEDILYWHCVEYERMSALDLPGDVALIIKDYLTMFEMFYEKYIQEDRTQT